MTAPALVLFDDSKARGWEPFSLTRPVGELLFGAVTQRRRAERALGLGCAGYLGCDVLAGFDETGAAPVLTEPPSAEAPRLFLCSRVVPAWGATLEYPPRPAAVEVEGQVLGWYAPAGSAAPSAAFLASPEAAEAPAERLLLPGRVLHAVWELVTENARQLVEDFGALGGPGPEPAASGPFSAIGSPQGWLRTGRNVRIEPGVVLDFTAGPIWLDHDVVIQAFTRLAGPAYIGPGSLLLGGLIGAVSVGPVCRLQGEVQDSVLLGYSNKAHAGFVGHSYLGRWVNVGAQTVTSNLKSNYGPIRVWTPAGVVDTGKVKLGSLLGDHVKTAIGTLLSTGAVVGAGSNLFGSDAPPSYVPPFTWGSGPELTPYDLDRFLAAAAAAMARRDVPLTEGMSAVLRSAWQRARARSD